MTGINEIRMEKIEKIIEEAKGIKSFFFSDSAVEKALPGQFLMIWLPGVDEVPMGISRIGKLSSITVKKVGDCTEKLHLLNEGDKIGIRGPFGNHFNIVDCEKMVVAGGIGIASLLPLIDERTEVFMGAKTRNRLPFLGEIKKRGARLHLATEDGSRGFKGMVTDLFTEFLGDNNHLSERKIYVCGPMEMIQEIYRRNKNREMEASLESHMKCGIGICDSCSIRGTRICKEGPVISDLSRIFD